MPSTFLRAIMSLMLQTPFYLHIHVVNMGLPDMEIQQLSPVHTSLLYF